MADSRAAAIASLLQPTFASKHVNAAVKHFHKMTADFQQEDWEDAIIAGGKFIEAVLKALYLHVGRTLPTNAREFKAGTVMTHLEQTPAGTLDDAIRMTIPRACRFAYDIANNRGARHDPNEIDPNQMDARAVVSVTAWTLAEMVRYAQRNAVDDGALAEIVEGITARQYPLIEDVEGRVYFHFPGVSAKDVAILSLWHRHPGRLTEPEVVAAVMRHKFTKKNADVAISRLGRLVDYDEKHRIRLLQPGIELAEKLIATAQLRRKR